MACCQVNQARNRWSDVLDQAESDGPQIITHHGKERAVLLSIETYRTLTQASVRSPESKPDFNAFLLSGPKFDDFAIEQDTDTGREIDFS